MEHVVYLDDFFEFLESSGIDTSVINVVDGNIDPEYILDSDRRCNIIRMLEIFTKTNKKDSDNASEWLIGAFFI